VLNLLAFRVVYCDLKQGENQWKRPRGRPRIGMIDDLMVGSYIRMSSIIIVILDLFVRHTDHMILKTKNQWIDIRDPGNKVYTV